jgi:acyl transferase domain-containing protein
MNVAIDDLRNNRADVALVGAVSPPFSRALLQGFSGAINFSSKRTFVPFDEKACGTVPGEGCVFFVLKRREDALRSHDRILATIKSICCGNGGTKEVLSQAAQIAGIDIRSIEMVEANGSGIPEEDAEEIAAIQQLWGEHRPGGELVGIGSVKGNIGHCFRAAAASSLLKVAMSLKTKVLLPQLPPVNPLAAISHLGSSAYIINEARPWLTGNPDKPRYAAVLAKDFSGHHGAAILAEEIES